MGLSDWTRQVKDSSCGKQPWEKNQNAPCFKWCGTAEVGKWIYPPVGRDPQKRIWTLSELNKWNNLPVGKDPGIRIRMHFFQMVWNYWNREVKQSSRGKGPWEKNQNDLCSKLCLSAELDKWNNLPVGRDPGIRNRTHFVLNGVQLLN